VKIDSIKNIEKLKKSYTPQNIEKAVKWGRGDPFWSGQFLSPNKLAKKNKDGVLYMDLFLENSNNSNNGKSKSNNKINLEEYGRELIERLRA
jgi:hypothetical protein